MAKLGCCEKCGKYIGFDGAFLYCEESNLCEECRKGDKENEQMSS